MVRLVVIDNYDSFTYNLVQMFKQYKGLEVLVYRSDRIGADEIEGAGPDYLVVSPGPKDPAHAGISREIIKRMYSKIPVLGVCLGMQCINEVFGGKTVRAPVPMHGKTCMVEHGDTGIFKGVASPFRVARYHSLMAEPANSALTITARSVDGVIMGMSHPDFPLHGVQFHPESFLTEHGFNIVNNFFKLGRLLIDRQELRAIS